MINNCKFKIGQIGYGFVGKALHKSFFKRGVCTTVYDKYLTTNDGCPSSPFENLLECEIIFLCLPTPFVEGHGYDLSALLESCKRLKVEGYQGVVVIKSTVEPGVTQHIADNFPEMNFCHNPEFLTARTALEDFDNQEHIVIGIAEIKKYNQFKISIDDSVGDLYRKLYPDAHISMCTSVESETMKLFVNNFYAMKVQIFNEFFLLCQRTGADFELVKEMMLMNGWVNPMHTNVPGPDGKLSYGGACFPKDTSALNHFMKKMAVPHEVLDACVKERNRMRKD